MEVSPESIVRPRSRRLDAAEMKRRVQDFLGLNGADDEEQSRLWSDRRIRLAERRYGGLKNTLERDVPDSSAALIPPPRKKPSVNQYALEGLSTLKRKVLRQPTSTDVSFRSKSFVKTDPVTEEGDEVKQDVFFDGVPQNFYDDQRDGDGTVKIGLRRMDPNQISGLNDNSDRRVYGVGAVGELLGRSRRIHQKMDEIEDYRPYFTYWITAVQTIIVICSLVFYGIGIFDVSVAERSGFVLTEGLTLEQVSVREPGNFWFGPRPADLIHLGATFAPCIRRDPVITEDMERRRARESRETGCCVRNDRSGCVQTDRLGCSPLLSIFYNDKVCGQDPNYCASPLSTPPHVWPSNISYWPICRTPTPPRIGDPDHMTCEVIARPCCVGIHGKCEIRTEEYCRWVKGTFHREASLCSQVSCIQEVCGMLPFLKPDVPDQIYRLWSSLFLHAGIVHLIITLVVQLYFMRDLEKMCGPARMAVIYLGSGILGNLASAVFVPLRAESGPSGSQFGLLAAHFAEVINAWRLLRRPGIALLKLGIVTFLLLLIGFLPWVDNYAHIFGYLSGFLLSISFLPYVSYKDNRKWRTAIVYVGLILYFLLFVILMVLLYTIPVCEICKYLSCIPFTKDFCNIQNIHLFSKNTMLRL